ncbi:MAG: hypothetical protein ACI3YC_06415 [Alloprevotella sp.]
MKKSYIAPAVQIYDVDVTEMLALSLNDGGGTSLGNGNFESGDYEYCSDERGYWEHEW